MSEASIASANRRIRVFISSTFRDMIAERDELMSHTWPELRRLCRELHVELVEVDLRWGIAEGQSTRNETLKLCLDEIRACRPFFIGLLGERYGWTPGDDAFTADLKEEQPWLKDLRGRSVTELEILHGVLNNPDMAGRAFFYFRDPAYAASRGPDFQSENTDSALKQTALKTLIRAASQSKQIPLHENYPDPVRLAALVLADLTAAIEAQFPKENVPDALTREAQDHEAFAEIRRRTYIGRADYFDALDHHAASDGGPLLLLGESGSGKSALLANWLERWRKDHPKDFIIQHYIGGTADSASHWRLMSRVMAEIKRWTDDPEAVPTELEKVLKDFPLWLTKARAWAGQKGLRCILVLDALNQLDEQDHARLLGWLPEPPFSGPLRLIVSALPGNAGADDPLTVLQKRHWQEMRVPPLSVDERRRMIAGYLARFGKQLDAHRLDRLASAPAAANPLYLKILLDDLRVTGTHQRLDERLTEYLTAADIPTLLQQVLARYQRDYERDRPGLVSEALGLIYAARRGLTETELLHLLRPKSETGQPYSATAQLPPAHWTPLRAALEDSLIDRGGILNFAHDFLRTAVETAFVPDQHKRDDYQLQLADDFEAQPITARTCDELPWLLRETESLVRLRACLLNIDRFLLIQTRDEEELRGYWVKQLGEQQTMGKDYLESFETWSQEPGHETSDIAYTANQLAMFLHGAALHVQAEPLMRRALAIDEEAYGARHPNVARDLNNLTGLLHDTNRLVEAEPLMRRALAIDEQSHGANHPNVARDLNNLATMLYATNRLPQAEPLMRRALAIIEQSFGSEHPYVAACLNNLAGLLQDTNRLAEAEPLMRRALAIDEQACGAEHPTVAIRLNNLAGLLEDTNRLAEAEPLMRRALTIDEQSYGAEHPDVARDLNNLAQLLKATNRLPEAEPLIRRALAIDEQSYGVNHPAVATRLGNLALLLTATNRLAEAEPLIRRALAIDEQAYGAEHPTVAIRLNNLAALLKNTNRLAEAEPLMRRALAINEQSYGAEHPHVANCLNYLAALLKKTNRLAEAEPLMRRALTIDEQSYGAVHPKVAACLNNLASLLQDTNRLAEAEPLIRRALAINEQSFGAEHPNVASSLNTLALLLQDTNRLAEAEPLIRRALAIDEASYGAEHPSVAIRLSNLGLLLHATKCLVEAEPLMRRALAIDEQSYGAEHPTVAIRLNNLAGLLYTTKRLAEAEPLMRRALAIDEQSYGAGHPNVAIRLNNLAHLLQVTNRLAEAKPLMQQSFLIFLQSLGLQHPKTQTHLDNYIRLLQAMDQTPEQIQSTLDELGRRFGIDLAAPVQSPKETAIVLNNRALELRKAGQLAKAEPLMRQALELDEKARGSAHPKIPHRLNNLCTVLIMQGKLEEARLLLARAWELKSGQHDLTSTRLLFVRITAALLNAQSLTPFLGQLKTLLATPDLPDHADVVRIWEIAYFVDHPATKLGPQNVEFLQALAAALNDRSKLPDLDRFPAWRDQAPVPLEIPWPENS